MRPSKTCNIMRGSRKFSGGGGGGGRNSQKGSDAENFNIAKINNLAIPGVGVGEGGGSGPPVPPSGSTHEHGY